MAFYNGFTAYSISMAVTCAALTSAMPPAHAADSRAEDALITIKTIKSRKVSLEERLRAELPKFKGNVYTTLSIENDMIGDGGDRYYTSGVRATWFKAGADTPDFAETLDDYIPTFDVNESTSVYFSLGQNLYTPQRIDIEAPQLGDRPWAAWLYGSMGLLSVTDNHIDEVELSLGVVGPYALGKPAQRFVHKLWEIQDPRGWQNQLKTEPGVILSWERRFPAALSIESADIWFDLSPSYGVTVGNIYTHANAGLTFQIGPEFQRWQDMPVRVRPSMPGTGFFAPIESKTKLGWNIFGGADARLVGRNLFLDGNTFRDSPSVNKEHVVYDLNLGAALTYQNIRASYTFVRRSKEFEAQDKPSYFGGLSVTFQF